MLNHVRSENAPTSSTTPATDADIPSFPDLGVSPDLVRTLERQGIDRPFPVQALTIPHALEGRDICGKAKTGSGKTLAFGLPLIERTTRAARGRPHSLILVPTRELANQVSRDLKPLAKRRHLKLASIYGGMSLGRQIQAVRAGVDVVVATPGRLLDLMDRREILLDDIETVVLDEADHMADLGFLPQVDRILRRIHGDHQTMLFSATLDGMVDTIVRRYMHDPVYHEVPQAESTVETMEHRFIAVHAADRVKAAAVICRSAERILVFVRTKRGTDRLAEQLQREGVDAEPIHGDLRQSQREKTLRAFSQGRLHVLVATNVAARGLHVEGVDLVLHYDAPEDHKTYVHRSGRTARAGEAGLVVTFVSMERFADVKQMQEDAGLNHRIVAMKSDDIRLTDLGAWEPPTAPAKAAERPTRRSRLGHRTTSGGRRRRSRR
jgi:superfamily II DNA/RNA helicase